VAAKLQILQDIMKTGYVYPEVTKRTVLSEHQEPSSSSNYIRRNSQIKVTKTELIAKTEVSSSTKVCVIHIYV
jgi:hypothetical protein